ncbi:fimbrial biogenesis chaperone [Dryocola clanedunensis]|uniref:fimbrial biogenesis chaperone n=1 Tax=Cedecea sulfonylureivorans TaxID=3051154 RepID=UPI0019279174|nr:molecular chaperone [Cedecea sulfonylureivorans]
MRLRPWAWHSLISILFLCTSQLSQASVIIGGTRVIYDGSKKETSVSISNPTEAGKSGVFLVQSWVEVDESGGRAPFIVTPPLFRINASQENILRIVRTGGTLPADRESIFWLNVKAIPASDDNSQNVLQIVMKSRLKMFYRPAGLSGLPVEAYKQLSFSRSGGRLKVVNPTPYFVTFYRLKVGGTEIKEADLVPPKGSVTYPLPSDSAGKVVWQTINDYGGISEPETKPL